MSDASKAVFLSYASQDAEAARRICEALRAAGVEVWFDQSELVGGDQWDTKIRGQIGSCALFVPVISANTQARLEGYFRLEWKLAAQRTHTMADEKTFLLPVVVDATRDPEARVPVEFKSVQWTKLPGGETPPAFVQRVKKLLDGNVGASLDDARSEANHGRCQATPLHRPGLNKWWWALPIFGVTMALLLVMKESRKEPAPAGAPPAPSSPAVSLSNPSNGLTEAQKLVAQARKIYEDGDELNRENLYLAEELVQRALKVDSTEPTAWEFSAWLSYLMVWHLIDESPERRENLLRQASRAVALAPDSVAAQLVYANAQMAGRLMVRDFGQSHLEETEQSLLRLAGREPQNWKVQRALGTTFRMMNRTDDAIRTLERAMELSDGHPMAVADLVNLLIRRQRLPQAEALLAGALSKQRSGRLLTFDVVVKCRWRGDTVGALKAIQTWPTWLLQENRGLAVAWQAAFWGRQPEAALRVVQRFPRDEVRDINFAGPRAALSARAHELAGDTAAAQADWRVVERRCTQALAVNSQDIVALHWKAWALARLGDQSGAQAAATLMRQHLRSVASSFFNVNTVAPLWATVGWTDEALSELRTLMETPVDGYSLTRAYLELEPAFDPLRQDPRFQELVRLAPSPVSSLLPPSNPSQVDSKSVAVLAFANLSDDKANEYFSDGISEELLNVLAKVPGLKVSARTSAFYFKGKEVPIPEIAKQLGVAYVVEGSVRKAGDKVRITAQLIKAADGFHVWSDTFTRDLKDIFAVQDEIAGLIAKNLQLKLGDAARAAKTVNPEAHQLYLRARTEWRLRTTESYDRADALLRQALGHDPEFAPAYALLAYVALVRDDTAANFDAAGKPTPLVETALAYANRALQLDADSADAHVALAATLALVRRWPDAEREFRRAIDLNSNHATAHQWLARLLEVDGRMDEAMVAIRYAAELDPLSSRIFDNLAMILIHSGRLAEAREAIERAVLLQPDSRQALTLKTEILIRTGKLEEARPLAADAVNRLLTSNPVDTTNGHVCRVLVGITDRARAVAAYERIPGSEMAPKLIAAMQVGRNAEALAGLEPTAFSYFWTNELLWNDTLDPIRDAPEFRTFLQKAGLAEAHVRVQAWRAAHPPEKTTVKN